MRAARRVLLALGTAAVAVVAVASGAGGAGNDLAEVRAATARFHRLSTAQVAGYGLSTDAAGLACIEDPGGAGAMGTHFVNGALVGDGLIDAARPEALLYDRTGSGDRLLGVEYVVLVSDWAGEDPPSLFGHEFHLVEEPNRYGLPPFYELHAWVWKQNPAGTLEDWNPLVDC